MQKLLIALGLFLLFPLAPALSQDLRYNNSRFGFSLAYPGELFYPGSESDNGDGIVAKSRDGRAELRAYGSYAPSVLGKTLRSMYAEELRRPGRQVTYKRLNSRQAYYAVSGYESGRVFYNKTFVINGTQATLEFHYDIGSKAIYDEAVRRVVGSFLPGGVGSLNF